MGCQRVKHPSRTKYVSAIRWHMNCIKYGVKDGGRGPSQASALDSIAYPG